MGAFNLILIALVNTAAQNIRFLQGSGKECVANFGDAMVVMTSLSGYPEDGLAGVDQQIPTPFTGVFVMKKPSKKKDKKVTVCITYDSNVTCPSSPHEDGCMAAVYNHGEDWFKNAGPCSWIGDERGAWEAAKVAADGQTLDEITLNTGYNFKKNLKYPVVWTDGVGATVSCQGLTDLPTKKKWGKGAHFQAKAFKKMKGVKGKDLKGFAKKKKTIKAHMVVSIKDESEDEDANVGVEIALYLDLGSAYSKLCDSSVLDSCTAAIYSGSCKKLGEHHYDAAGLPATIDDPWLKTVHGSYQRFLYVPHIPLGFVDEESANFTNQVFVIHNAAGKAVLCSKIAVLKKKKKGKNGN